LRFDLHIDGYVFTIATSSAAHAAHALDHMRSCKDRRPMSDDRPLVYDQKRGEAQTLATAQAGNRTWWQSHTMSYDWHGEISAERFSPHWFDEIDRRFIADAALFGHNAAPFDRIIPFPDLRGKSVLEIGSGMGLHAELMARAGASVTAVDISDTSIEATRQRARIKGLPITCRRMDATSLDFADETFDFVWSWGVIHHSARTGRIVREIHRVLRPGGQTRVMVYNLAGMSAYITIVRKYLAGFWRGGSLDEYLWASTDGYMARFYTPDGFADLFRTFFDDVAVTTVGQLPDAIPLPSRPRRYVARFFPQEWLARRGNERGSFLFLTATKS
jgi:2-polyprenyl-3-methyl-5-hydroxy-6-metoxy-1,4-benzoquinol methylase